MKSKFFKRAATVFMSLVIILAFCACGNGGPGGENPGQEPRPAEFDRSEYRSLPEIRFGSFYGSEESGECKLKMRVPFDDTFDLSFAQTGIKSVTVFDEDGGLLAHSQESFDIELKADDLVYMSITPVQSRIKLDVTAKNHLSRLPFDIEGAPDTTRFDTSSTEGDPLTAAEIAAAYRDHGKLIMSNTPERVEPQYVNTAFTRHDVSDEEIFFTFEHGSGSLPGGAYYGYQVLNTDDEDIYVTVKNVGYQAEGAGAYYGERAWTAFYNTKFELPDASEWSEGAMNSFNAWFGFSGDAYSSDFQPITYRVPAGKYIYVVGGTTSDAYNHYNVGKTANRLARRGCQSGAVLFDVVGKAEGIFYVYDDPDKVGTDNKTPGGGLPRSNYGSGGAIINGINDGTVVETRATWEFNDNTKAQLLPVTFTNYYAENSKGEPFGKVKNIPRERTCNLWYTHCNSHFCEDALGVDTIELSTVCDGEPVKSGINYFVPFGNLSDMGNWMVDYIDTYTFVNRGDRDRDITVMVNPCVGGALSVLARDQKGDTIPGSEKFSMYRRPNEYGDTMDGVYYYTFTVTAHSVRQISFEYNLLANSYGRVSHSVELH